MPLEPFTTHDHVQQLIHLGRKTWRHGWLIAVFAVVGTALSLAFAITQPRTYRSWSTLFYQEPITSDVLLPGHKEAATRDLGNRYRELLLAGPQLEQIVSDRSLDPFPDEDKVLRKLDRLRQAVRLVARGTSTFRIEYTDRDPARARRVTEKLAQLLQDKDQQLRIKQATQSLEFARQQEAAQLTVLHKSEQDLAAFLVAHPEFATERPSARPSSGPGVDPGLEAKQRQIDRIQRRLQDLDGPAANPASQDRRDSAAERLARAHREFDAAQNAMRELGGRLTEQHPDYIQAARRLDAAREELKQAEAAAAAAVPASNAPVPTAADERAQLERDLQQLKGEVTQAQAQAQAQNGKTSPADGTTKQLVQLELDHDKLQRDVTAQRESARRLTDAVFASTLDTNQKLAEQGGRLTVIDPAFEPLVPIGPGRTIVVMMGVFVFSALGLLLAFGLAAADDRLYRDIDLDRFQLRLLAVIPPARPRRGARRATPRRKGSDSAGKGTSPGVEVGEPAGAAAAGDPTPGQKDADSAGKGTSPGVEVADPAGAAAVGDATPGRVDPDSAGKGTSPGVEVADP